jgi:hypothetical protein
MKSYAVLILLFVCLVAGILLHASNKKRTELDNMTAAIQGAQRYLTNVNALSIKTEPMKTELLLYPRYILAPRELNVSGKYDTTLVIRYVSGSDTNLSTFLSTRRIIWQYADDQYHYSLSTANR